MSTQSTLVKSSKPPAFSALVTGLLSALDVNTRDHCERVAVACVRFGQYLGLCEDELQKLELAARLHDVGKRFIPAAVLDKQGDLTNTDIALLHEHAEKGAQLVNLLPVLRSAVPAVMHHHEHYDGSGYPDALAGDDIPLHARIIAIIDAYDAMTFDRSYRAGTIPSRARAVIEHNAGTQFDPDLVREFITMKAEAHQTADSLV